MDAMDAMETTTQAREMQIASAAERPAHLDWPQRQIVRGLALFAFICFLCYAATHAFMLLAQLSPYAADQGFATNVYIDYVRAGCFIFAGMAALGAGAVALAGALARALPASARSRLGLYLLCIVGVCQVFAALFADDAPNGPTSSAGTIHTAAALVALLAIAVAPLLLARGFRHDSRFRAHAIVCFVLGGLAVVALVYALIAVGFPVISTSLGLFSPESAPFMALTLLWLALTALQVRRVVRA